VEREPASTSRVPVRPRHCDAQSMVHAARYHEFFEDSFLDWRRARPRSRGAAGGSMNSAPRPGPRLIRYPETGGRRQ
jgi:hypothetical protein